MFKVALTQKIHDDGMAVLQKNAEITLLNLQTSEINEKDIVDQEGLIIRIGTIGREAILRSPRLRVIGRTGVGYDNVDINAATEAGIPVVITPNANTLSVVEHTLALILSLSKDMIFCDRELRKGNFQVRNRFKAFELANKTLGVIGFGNIGKEVARLGKAMGMQVIVYDPVVPQEHIESHGYQSTQQLASILCKSDILTLHIPLLDSTKNLIGKKELSLMKKGSLLINCSRGGTVDEEALYETLSNGLLGGAALDVFQNEPPGNHKLLSLENVIVTPHMAAQTKEAASRMATMAAEGVLAILNGHRWPHVVNPEAFTKLKKE